MLHAGLDLSRRRLDVCLIDDRGEVSGETAVPPLLVRMDAEAGWPSAFASVAG